MAFVNGIRQGAGLGTIGSSTDNAVPRWDGTGGDTVQDSGVTVDDSDVIDANGLEVTS